MGKKRVVNDTYGHQEGDRILDAMAKTLMRVARNSDICCRYGGEEFTVIPPLTDAHEAGAIANRMKIELAEHLPGGRTVTVSIGAASCWKKTEAYRDLVGKADAALIKRSKSGNNWIVVIVAGQGGSDVNGIGAVHSLPAVNRTTPSTGLNQWRS